MFEDTAGSKEEEEVLGLCSPTWELEGEDMQDNQVSDWEDIEAGDTDPLILKQEDEKYETQGEAQEQEAPSEDKSPGEKKGRRLSEGTAQEGAELPGRRAGERRRHRRKKTSESGVEQLDGDIEGVEEGPTPKPTGRKREIQKEVQEKRDLSSQSSETPRGQKKNEGMGSLRSRK